MHEEGFNIMVLDQCLQEVILTQLKLFSISHPDHGCKMVAVQSKAHTITLPYNSNQQDKYVQL
jgi:hypothetical protein